MAMSVIGLEIEKPTSFLKPLVIRRKTLMGPGPSNCTPRVLQALSQPVIGHFHEETFQLMNEIKEGIKYIFQTKNKMTLALSASGHAGLEAAMCNLVENGDTVLIAVNGVWGQRASDIAARHGAKVVTIETPVGTNFKHSVLEEAIIKYKPVLLFIVQGESSAGVYQPLLGLGRITRRYDCLLVVDTVASLGGVEFHMDKWCIDCVYTGSQKVLGAPPGITPISFSPKAVAKIKSRKTPVSVYNFDMNLLSQYWNCTEDNTPRYYHHTISTTLLYGLREALAQVIEEGLEQCQKRHQQCCQILHQGVKQLGLELFVNEESARLPTVTTIIVPAHVNWKTVSEYAMKNDFEISGGLGPTVGRVWRIGIMGANATPALVAEALNIFKEALLHAQSKL